MTGLTATVVVEYGHRIDCTKNGCATAHPDDGMVLPCSKEWRFKPTQNGHAVTAVERTVTYSSWSEGGD